MLIFNQLIYPKGTFIENLTRIFTDLRRFTRIFPRTNPHNLRKSVKSVFNPFN